MKAAAETQTLTGFLGADGEALAGRPESCRVVAPNLHQVVGVGLHALQPGVGVCVGRCHSLRPCLALLVIPPELHLKRTIMEICFLKKKQWLNEIKGSH